MKLKRNKYICVYKTTSKNKIIKKTPFPLLLRQNTWLILTLQYALLQTDSLGARRVLPKWSFIITYSMASVASAAFLSKL